MMWQQSRSWAVELVAKNEVGLPDVGGMTDEALLAELAASLEITARHLVRLAAVWSELERRGMDLSKLRSGLREWLPMIASGRIAAEAVVQFAGQNQLLRALSELPLYRQREFAAGEQVIVLTFGPAGGFNSEKIPPHRLTPADISLVFDKGHVRSAEEQMPILQDRARRRQRRSAETVTLELSAMQYQSLVRAAKARRMRVPTLIVDVLRVQGLLA